MVTFLTVNSAQMRRFRHNISSHISELIVCSLLNDVADDVELRGGRKETDVIGRLGPTKFDVEVKSAWWSDRNDDYLEHSPLRPTQCPDLVALVGAVREGDDLKVIGRISPRGVKVRQARLIYLVPAEVIRQSSQPDGRSTARSLIPLSAIEDYEVDMDAPASRLTRSWLAEILDEGSRSSRSTHSADE